MFGGRRILASLALALGSLATIGTGEARSQALAVPGASAGGSFYGGYGNGFGNFGGNGVYSGYGTTPYANYGYNPGYGLGPTYFAPIPTTYNNLLGVASTFDRGFVTRGGYGITPSRRGRR